MTAYSSFSLTMSSLTHSERLAPGLSFLTNLTFWQWFLVASGILVTRAVLVSIYNVFFHPLAKYPGPRLASISDIWTAYHYSSGKWPWVIERTIKEYGDIVRIGPNSLVFLEPQAAIDIHGSKRNLRDTFIKTPLFDGIGDEDDGLLWERDPVKHRAVSKTMSPAFSGNSLRAKIPTLNKHIDIMISQMKEHDQETGLDIGVWLTWLAMDSAVDLACGWELHELRDMKSHAFLEGMDAAGMLVIILATTKIYPILTPAVMLLTPWRLMRSLPQMAKALRAMVLQRIETRDNLKHSDFFEQLLPPGKAAPKTTKQFRHMVTVIGQLIIGGYDTTSVTSYMFLHFCLRNPEVMEELKREVRETFSSYDDITVENLWSLPWLNACLQETLRVVTVATHHSLPRISPGATVDGLYVPKGVTCRTSLFTYNRSERFFHDPSNFRPERWLSPDHPKYDPIFAHDDRRAYMPFITGPRQCPGRELAKITFRLVVAKLIWSFDIKQVSKPLEFDRDFRVYSNWLKPELRLRFFPVKRQCLVSAEH
ncbi:cytochrome P450 [Xylariaceae sp. AK1471]|nr:cytochrome P450 [Xylariaceae sp. AK1471]